MFIVVSKLDGEGNKAIYNTKRHEKVRQRKAEEMRSKVSLMTMERILRNILTLKSATPYPSN